MTEQMTLKELGETYLAEACNLEELIANCRKRRMLAMQTGDCNEAARQERLIESHRRQQDDLIELGLHMRDYYKKHIR